MKDYSTTVAARITIAKLNEILPIIEKMDSNMNRFLNDAINMKLESMKVQSEPTKEEIENMIFSLQSLL